MIHLRKNIHTIRTFATAGLCVITLLGCHYDMWNQPRLGAHQANDYYANNSAARLPVEGTVQYSGASRKWTHPVYEKLSGSASVPGLEDTAFWQGKQGDAFVGDNYFEITPELLARGQERYNISCSVCHGYVGGPWEVNADSDPAAGYGVIVQRGFPVPPSYHIDRLREVEDGYLFDVITNGFGRMYSYAARVAPEDRWAIAAYTRALQYSQYADTADSALRQAVDTGVAAQAAAAEAAAHAHGHETGHGEAHGEAGDDQHNDGSNTDSH